MRRFAAIVLVVAALPMAASATATYWAVNHITREYCRLEDGGLYSPLGWSAAPEMMEPGDLRARGFSQTTFPFKIEGVLGGTVILMIGVLIAKRRRRRLPTMPSNTTSNAAPSAASEAVQG